MSPCARAEPARRIRARVSGRARDNSEYRTASARSVAEWPATAANAPGSARNSIRIAATSTGSVSCMASAVAAPGRPSRSARAYGVRNDTLARPRSAPRTRRAARPARFDGTITVTAASGSAAWARRISSSNANVAGRP